MTTSMCCNYLNSWPWSAWTTDRLRRSCQCHAWLLQL